MDKITLSQNTLKYTYGLVVLAIGLDKLFRTDIIVNWDIYISPFVASMLPVSTDVFLAVIAIVEVVVGAVLLSGKWTRLFAYVSAAWLVLISINLLMLGFVDIAARDLVLAVGAVVLAWLTESLEERAVNKYNT